MLLRDIMLMYYLLIIIIFIVMTNYMQLIIYVDVNWNVLLPRELSHNMIEVTQLYHLNKNIKGTTNVHVSLNLYKL